MFERENDMTNKIHGSMTVIKHFFFFIIKYYTLYVRIF